MKIERLVVGPEQTNCYLLINDGDLVIVDPGAGARRIIDKIESYDAKVQGILLTHGHFDHIGAVDTLYNKYNCKIYASKDDEKILTDIRYNSYFGESATVTSPVTWLDSASVSLGNLQFDVIYSPGHTSGSVMYRYGNCLFSGDTLFKESVGRTDLYSGSYSQLLQSLEVIKELPYDMVVFPGHGFETTIGEELKNNPFLQ